MLKQHVNLDDPKTGVPSELYKENYDKIFKNSLWRKRQSQDPVLCGACGIDMRDGKKCKGCTDAVDEMPRHDAKAKAGDW